MRNILFVFGCVLAASLVVSPLALADQTNLTLNNCGTGCTPAVPQGTVIGTVDVEQGANADTLTVTLTMAPAFSMKVEAGNDFSFNAPSGLTLAVSNVAASWSGGGNSNVNFGVRTGRNVSEFGTFGYSITGIGSRGPAGGHLHDVTSVSTLTFTITASGAITPAELMAAMSSKGADFAIHFCDASGTNCATSTGFAASGGSSGVPEPPVLSMLACSVLVFGCFFRRFL